VKFVAGAATILLIVLTHLGAIAIILANSGLVAASAAVALLLIAQLFAKGFSSHGNPELGRRAISIGAVVLLITGALLVLSGFATAHLCNANINLLDLCAYPRSVNLICHKVGPVLLLLGLIGSVAGRHLRAINGG
jgi:hypothetical protein